MIGIIDADLITRKKHRFPNLASMKISGYCKAQGHDTRLIMSYEEVWKPIPKMLGYEASNLGNVRNVNWRSPGRIRNLTKVHDRDGYYMVCLSPNGKQCNYRVHRLVAMAFIPNPEGKTQVNHINEVRDDNRVENLEWVDCPENNNYGFRNKRISKTKTNSNCKRVLQYDLQGKLLCVYPSVHEVTRQTGYDTGFIARCCSEKTSSAYGYVWKYEEGGATDDPGNNGQNAGTDGNPAQTREPSGSSD